MKTIVAALDFDHPVTQVVEAAQNLATAFGASIHLIHVEPPEPDFVGYEPGPQYIRDNVAQEQMEAMDTAHGIAEALRAQGLDAQGLVIQGQASEKILEEAARLGADLLVLGNHAHGRLHNLLSGSVAEAVMRHATCAVLLIPLRQQV